MKNTSILPNLKHCPNLWAVLFFIVSILFFNTDLKAQITIEENHIAGEMLNRYSSLSRMQETTSGWRVQLLATTDRMKLESTLKDLEEKYPDLKIHWEHAAPYFRLRAGAFKKKLDAYQLLQSMKEDFPSAYLIRDKKIPPAEFVGL